MRTPAALLLLVTTIASAAAADRPIRFWNLTLYTISDFRLAPAGTTKLGGQPVQERQGRHRRFR